MKKTLKSKLTIGLFALASIFVFAGCSVRQSLDEFREENGLVAKVTYFANDGGKFENNSDVKTIYYKDGDKALEVGVTSLTSGSISIEKDNYQFLGWYFVELDEEGKPVRNADNEIVLGDAVDFSVAIEEGQHWYVCAKWQKLSVVEVKLLCDADVTLTVGEDENVKTYKNGDVIHSYNFNTQGLVQSTSNAPIKANDGTFVEFTANVEGTEEVSWPIQRPEDGADVTIYAKYIQGVWTLLRTADDVKTLFSSESALGNKAYYLMNDIDCTGLTRVPLNIFNSELQGNGYTISNLTFSNGSAALTAGAKVSMFGTIKAGAIIENVTFDNVTINYTIRPGAGVETYLVYTAMEAGAKINTVTINAKMTVEFGADAYLINDKDKNWKYGGAESDEAFESANPNTFITSGSAYEAVLKSESNKE